MLNKLTIVFVSVFFLPIPFLFAQSILPPLAEWKGKSELSIAKTDHPWITPTEKAGFVTTPDYAETIAWLKKLSEASPLIEMISIGKSPEGRDIHMVIASSEKTITSNALKNSAKPSLLIQGGIHAGEIDGKDASMMLLRDIAFGDKKQLLDAVNILIIPILNVDGHERSSAFNRPNQRGPQNMGWRTNAQNLNLNRDYAKQDTKEIQAVTQVINDYDPLLYMDIHVTDGADYQYDITFGGNAKQGYSHGISDWLNNSFKSHADEDLKRNGHIPGPLLFTVNNRDFSQGNIFMLGEPRFSHAYGDARHTATVLVENHSLKPFKQRVLGTYVLLESTIRLLAREGPTLRKITQTDRAKRIAQVPLRWQVPQQQNAVLDSLDLLGIESTITKSALTNSDYVTWTGKPTRFKIPSYRATEGSDWVARPKAYYIPAANQEIIERLKKQGIQLEILKQPREVLVEMYRIQDAKFQNAEGQAQPFEGHMQVTASTKTELRKQLYAKGSAVVSTDQPLGDLAILLLEPKSPDSYFSWGFFYPIFQRTEYIEAYVMEPTMKKMLEDSPVLKTEFEKKKAEDKNFASNANAIFNWFYSKTNYYDDRYLLYPVGRESAGQ
jgi:hypothetical protein